MIKIFYPKLYSELATTRIMNIENTPKVVIQLSDNSSSVQKATLQQLYNLKEALPDVLIELVTHSKGIDLLMQGSPWHDILGNLSEKNIKFLVCQNTLKDREGDAAQLLTFAEVIPSAVAHIVLRQQAGWSYLKAGF